MHETTRSESASQYALPGIREHQHRQRKVIRQPSGCSSHHGPVPQAFVSAGYKAIPNSSCDRDPGHMSHVYSEKIQILVALPCVIKRWSILVNWGDYGTQAEPQVYFARSADVRFPRRQPHNIVYGARGSMCCLKNAAAGEQLFNEAPRGRSVSVVDDIITDQMSLP